MLEQLRDPDRLKALYASELLEATSAEALDRLCRQTQHFLEVPVALVNLVDEDCQVTVSARDAGGSYEPGQITPLRHSFCKYPVAARRPLIVEDARTDPRLREIPEVVEGEIIGYLGVPLITGEGHALGTLCVIEREPRRWTDEEVATVEDLAESVTTVIELRTEIRRRRRLEGELERRVRERTFELEAAQREILARLAAAGEYRDDETGKHTRRVGVLSKALALVLGQDEDWAHMLGQAAPLHDLGKVGIPDDILLKEGPLDDDEFEVMKRHTVIGAHLLTGGQSELVRLAETIARSHHERWDGTGYPEGLEAEAIPLAGRIVAVADAFDAMTHVRPYRSALSLEEALSEILQGRGGQFAPEVADAMLSHTEELLSRSEFPASPSPRVARRRVSSAGQTLGGTVGP